MPTCNECSSVVERDAMYCPYCGEQVRSDTPRSDQNPPEAIFYFSLVAAGLILVTIMSIINTSTMEYALVVSGMLSGLFFFMRAGEIRKRNGIIPSLDRMKNSINLRKKGFANQIIEKGKWKTIRGYLAEATAIALIFTLYWVFIDIPLSRYPDLVGFVEMAGGDAGIFSDFLGFLSFLSNMLLTTIVLGWIFYTIFTPMLVILTKMMG